MALCQTAFTSLFLLSETHKTLWLNRNLQAVKLFRAELRICNGHTAQGLRSFEPRFSFATVTHIKRNRIYAKNRLQAEARGAIILYLDYVSSWRNDSLHPTFAPDVNGSLLHWEQQVIFSGRLTSYMNHRYSGMSSPGSWPVSWQCLSKIQNPEKLKNK